MAWSNRKSQLAAAGILALALAGGTVVGLSAQESPTAQNEATPTPEPEAGPLMVTVHPFPSYGSAPLTVGFILSSNVDEDDPIVSYEWHFGDGQVSTRPPQVLFHTYAQPGSYVVTVSVTTASGRLGIGMGAVIASPAAR